MIGRAFKSDGFMWLVVGESRYGGYFNCINTDSQIVQYNARFLRKVIK